jgi:hypothetical protein
LNLSVTSTETEEIASSDALAADSASPSVLSPIFIDTRTLAEGPSLSSSVLSPTFIDTRAPAEDPSSPSVLSTT